MDGAEPSTATILSSSRIGRAAYAACTYESPSGTGTPPHASRRRGETVFGQHGGETRLAHRLTVDRRDGEPPGALGQPGQGGRYLLIRLRFEPPQRSAAPFGERHQPAVDQDDVGTRHPGQPAGGPIGRASCRDRV